MQRRQKIPASCVYFPPIWTFQPPLFHGQLLKWNRPLRQQGFPSMYVEICGWDCRLDVNLQKGSHNSHLAFWAGRAPPCPMGRECQGWRRRRWWRPCPRGPSSPCWRWQAKPGQKRACLLSSSTAGWERAQQPGRTEGTTEKWTWGPEDTREYLSTIQNE